MSETLDLLLLVPGNDDREAVTGILERRESLGVRPIAFRTIVHPNRDPGCFKTAPAMLQAHVRTTRQAIVIFDHLGSGQESRTPEELETDLGRRLDASGWKDRAEVIVIRPELEVWIWSDSPRVDEALGWRGRRPGLRRWLKDEGLWPEDAPKPPRPQICYEKALEEANLPESSAIFAKLARTVGLDRCRDRVFLRLKEILRQWFPEARR
jgi:hypothetical protein